VFEDDLRLLDHVFATLMFWNALGHTFYIFYCFILKRVLLLRLVYAHVYCQ